MLRFIYTNAKGETAEWALSRWKENSIYIQGRTETDFTPRTFRKDRVQEYLEGDEQLLFELAPPAAVPAPRAPADTRPKILFTGFKAADRQRLETWADAQGLRVMKTSSPTLSFLCIGYNAGPSKVEAAREAGAFIVSEEDLVWILETGELPG